MRVTYAVGAERCCPLTGNPGSPAEFEESLPLSVPEAVVFVAGTDAVLGIAADAADDADVGAWEGKVMADVDGNEAALVPFSCSPVPVPVTDAPKEADVLVLSITVAVLLPDWSV